MTITEATWQEQKRAELVAHAEFLHAYQKHVAYAQIRPIPDIHESMARMRRLFDSGFTWETDCSGAIDWIFDWSGMKTPTGYPYGWGGTSAMYSHLTTHFDDPAHAHPGTIGVYGYGGDDHGVMVVQAGRTREDTLVFSHGIADVCSIGSLSDMDAGFVGVPFTFLSILPLFPPLPSVKTRGAHT